VNEQYTRELLTILNQYTQREGFDDRPWARGGEQEAERLLHVADWCAATWTGDLIHITCQISPVSRALGAVARKHGRRLVILLPWVDSDAPLPRPCRDDDHERSRTQIVPYQDITDVVIGRLQFQAPAHICLGVVNPFDDFNTYMHDIGLVAHAGLIAVKDSLWQEQVARAALMAGYEHHRGMLQHPLCREGYLLP